MARVSEGEVKVALEPRASGVVARVTIDRAGKANALNTALMQRFVTTIDGLAGEAELRAVVLTGAGERAFIGGADIEEMAGLDAETARSFITHVHRCCEALRRLPVPVIARINGYTIGAGLEIAAACDLRVAAEGALFGMPEVRLGIPSVVEAALLPMLIGHGRTRRLLLLGETISAAEALEWGIVERVVAGGVLDSALDEWVEALLACGPGTIRLQKRLILDWEKLPPEAAVEAGIDAFVEAWQTPEPGGMMRDFLAAKGKRKSSG